MNNNGNEREKKETNGREEHSNRNWREDKHRKL